MQRQLPRRARAQDPSGTAERQVPRRAQRRLTTRPPKNYATRRHLLPPILWLPVCTRPAHPRSAAPARCPSRGDIFAWEEASGEVFASARGLLLELPDEHLLPISRAWTLLEDGHWSGQNAGLVASTARHGFGVATSNLSTLHNSRPYIRKVEAPHVEPEKHPPWVPRNRKHVLVVRPSVYPVWT